MSTSQPRILLPKKPLIIVVLKKRATAICNYGKKNTHKSTCRKAGVINWRFSSMKLQLKDTFFKQFSFSLRAISFDHQYLLPNEFLSNRRYLLSEFFSEISVENSGPGS